MVLRRLRLYLPHVTLYRSLVLICDKSTESDLWQCRVRTSCKLEVGKLVVLKSAVANNCHGTTTSAGVYGLVRRGLHAVIVARAD